MNTQQMEYTWKDQYIPPTSENYNLQSIYELVLNDSKEPCKIEKILYKADVTCGTFISLTFPKPVYVTKKQNGTQELRYNSNLMELEKIYPVTWNDKKYGIQRTHDGVDILRFYPEQT